ncbi:hypothetical protein DFQ28_009146, partial [Apophysomyces sp. BC1034]
MVSAYKVTQEQADIQPHRAIPEVSRQLQNLNVEMDVYYAIIQGHLAEHQHSQHSTNINANLANVINDIRQDRHVLHDLRQYIRALYEACSIFASESQLEPGLSVIAASGMSSANPAAPMDLYILNRDVVSVERIIGRIAAQYSQTP